jgi:UDP-N-acetylmuramoylalanine--D-glutamate ligase
VIKTNFFASKRNVLIIGFGKTGRSAHRFLKERGHRVFVHDDFNESVPDSFDPGQMSDIDIAIKSPSVPLSSHNRHAIIENLLKDNIPIISAFDVFILYNPTARVIGITGTNGKSTTTALTYHIMKNAGIDAQIGGNIGIPYLDVPESTVYIFEMSSYELESSHHLKFEIGCILNIYPDHLKFHGDFVNYVAAKHKLLEHSQIKILSLEDIVTAEKFGYMRDVITVSTEYTPRANVYVFERAMMGGAKSVVLDLTEVPGLIGQHNYQNIEFAYAICRHYGIPDYIIAKGIRTFDSLPHRLNMIKKKLGNVLFVNDSKATNPESASKALATFLGYKIFWLVGGRSKNADTLSSVGAYLDSVQKIYLFGESADEFTRTFEGIKKTVDCKTMLSALRLAYKDAANEEGSVVILLSPMCASFDQFEDFEHRGNEFVKAVEALSNDAI